MSTTPRWTPAASAAAAAGPRRSIHDLPPEMLVAALSSLDAGSSLLPRFRDDPATLMDDDDDDDVRRGGDDVRRYPLKAASLVCRTWRGAVLPRLFRHVLWTIRRLEEPQGGAATAGGGGADGFELLAFLRENNLGGAVQSVMLYVPCPEHLIDDPTELVGRYGMVPSTAGAGAGAGMRGDEDEEDEDSVVLSETASLVLAEVNGHPTWPNTWFWDMLFAVVDPLRVSFLAAPAVLATMLSRKVFTKCQPLMMTRYHLLSVSRPDRAAPPPSADDDDDDDDDDDAPPPDPEAMRRFAPPCDNHPCELFARRRWTALLANEGSSVSIYKTGGYGQTPPSPLLSLLASRDPATRRFLRRALRRLEYVAVMPMATHLQAALGTTTTATGTTTVLVPPRLEELFVQVMPRGLLADPHAARRAGRRLDGLDIEDLVMERDTVYDMLFAGIFVPGPRPEWEPLRVFETGDAADEVAWAEAVEAVCASSSCWDVARPGRFVRNMEREEARRRRRRMGGGGDAMPP